MESLSSINEFLRYMEKNYSNPTALNVFENEKWRAYSTEEMLKSVKLMALGLISLGIKKGDRVGILAYPSPQWVIADLAIMVIGAITVPLFANISPENFLFEVEQTDIKTLFVSGTEQWTMFSRHKKLFNQLITFDNDNQGLGIGYDDLLKKGAQLDEEQPNLYHELESAVKPDDVATIIYTSGSTGTPKGVEITHRSLVSLIDYDKFDLNRNEDRFLSILPLAHVFGRTLNLYIIGQGVSAYYSNDLKNVGAICREIHPTFMVIVPRLLEKIYAKMLARVEQAGYMKRTLGKWAFELANMEDDSLFKTMMHPVVDKIIYSALREALGGKLRIVISGGAPLNPHLAHFFIDIGVPIYEGWGLTEAATVSVNNPHARKVGTVGEPLPRVEVKVNPDGELLVRGSLVMKGYYKEPALTAEVLDKDGWLHTGDKGMIDEDGYVKIIGRIKEMYKTSTGEYIAPVPIEQALCKAALIDMALVIGQDKKFASCLLFPDLDVLHSMKAAHEASNQSDEEFLDGPFVKAEMNKLIISINEHLNHWEKLHAYRFVLDHLTPESGELTPSMKVRRDVLIKKYSDLIDLIYPEEKL